MTNKKINVLVPIVSVLLGLIIGAIVMFSSGHSPIEGYGALWQGAFGDMYSVGETVRRTIPYILAGLAVAFAFRTGLFNIGAEGQLIVGWLAAVWVGIIFDVPMIIHLPLALLAAIVAGGFWGYIPGVLKARLGVHEVIVTIMLNYVALYLTNAVIQNVLTDNQAVSPNIHDSASLAAVWMQNLTDLSRVHYGIFIAIFAAILMWFIIQKTTLGYELKSVGFNPHASKYAGMSISKNITISMVIAGAFAGLAGAMEGLGTYGNVSVLYGFTNIGFDAIAIALLGRNNAFGVVIASLLFGALKQGASQISLTTGISSELVDIIIAVIILFAASGYIIQWGLSRVLQRGNK